MQFPGVLAQYFEPAEVVCLEENPSIATVLPLGKTVHLWNLTMARNIALGGKGLFNESFFATRCRNQDVFHNSESRGTRTATLSVGEEGRGRVKR